MTNKKQQLLFALLTIIMLISIPGFSQHVTIDDAILSRPAEAIAKSLRSPEFDLYNSKTFELKIKMIRALGKKENGNSKIIYNQLMLNMQEGGNRIARRGNSAIEFWKIRAESALSLGKLGNKKARKSLLKLAMKDDDMQVRMCAIRALGMLKAEKSVPRLLDLLSVTTTDRVANELVITLGNIGDKRAFPVLLAITQRNFTQYVRKNALLAIKKLKW